MMRLPKSEPRVIWTVAANRESDNKKCLRNPAMGLHGYWKLPVKPENREDSPMISQDKCIEAGAAYLVWSGSSCKILHIRL
jgi:hypothetical protein